MLNLWGNELAITSDGQTISDQPAAVLPDGRIVVVSSGGSDGWNSGVFGQILNIDGTPSGAAFAVNSTIKANQGDANVARLSDGRFVVTWVSEDQGDGGGVTCIRARVFNADGTPSTYNGSNQDFVVNTVAGGAQYNPTVTDLAGGGFVIAFASEEPAFHNNVVTRSFTATGPAGPDQFVVTVNNPYNPALLTLADGRFAMAWHQDFVTGGNLIQFFLANGTPDPSVNGGNPASIESTVVGVSHDAATDAHLALLNDGRILATWVLSDNNLGNPDGDPFGAIRARVYLPSGVPDPSVNGGAEFKVNTTTNNYQLAPHGVGLADGGFLITFSSRSDPDADNSDLNVLGRVFSANGTPAGNDFMVEEGAFAGTSIASNAPIRLIDGRILALDNKPAGGDVIQGRFFDGSLAGVIFNGTSAAEQYGGTIFNDTLNGGGGSDYLAADRGDDVLNGGAGNDTLTGGAGADTFRYAAATDSITAAPDGIADFTRTEGDKIDLSPVNPSAIGIVQSGAVSFVFVTAPSGSMQINVTGDVEAFDITTGGIGVTLQGDNTATTLLGGASNDSIFGNGGNDILAGGLGADVLFGGAGADTFKFIASSESNAGGADLIADFVTGSDKIDLSGASPAAIAIIDQGANSLVFANTAGGQIQIGSLGNVNGNDIVASIGVTIQGGAASSTLTGGGLSDYLFGEDGNDTLIGGAGVDILFGGSGADTFRYTAPSESNAAAPDLIADFQTGVDKIDLSAAGMTSAGIASNIVFASGPGGTMQIGSLQTVALADIILAPGPAPLEMASLAHMGIAGEHIV